MTKLNFTIDQNDLKTLFIHTKFAYNGLTFSQWVGEIKESYSDYFNKAKKIKTFSEWINGQIIALT